MRRTLAAGVVALALAASVLSISTLSAVSSAADDTRPTADQLRAATTDGAAGRTLDRAVDALTGKEPGASTTLALRDLFVALSSLRTEDSREAHRALARPNATKRKCAINICIHWKRTGADAPPGMGWVNTTLAVMRTTWKREVSRFGYRRPLRDGRRGGNGRFDVYLKNLGPSVYGYCAPERKVPGRWLASGYCVLDDDFARSQFGKNPLRSLKATAAHEFFHAIQFAYDYAEDGWFMEASATWMEERVFDEVNDNRQYLRAGQVAVPEIPLDMFNPSRSYQYGNWAFFEYLSQRFGRSIVRSAWNRAGDFPGAPDQYSIRAVRSSLVAAGRSFPSVFRAYTAGNTIPGTTYSEGIRWPRARVRTRHVLTSSDPQASDSFAVRHLASQNITMLPGSGAGSGSILRVRVNGPERVTDPAAYVLVHRESGRVLGKPVPLATNGNGTIEFDFSSSSVRRVTLTLANASTRFNCWQARNFSCEGIPTDETRSYGYTVRLVSPG